MKKYICLLASIALLGACEKKENTTVNPPGENKTENNTTVLKDSSPAAASKTETNTTVNTGSSPASGSSTTTTTSSPNP